MQTQEKKYYHISSLEKGVRVMELLADNRKMSVSAVAKKLNLNRATSHRFLATLRDLGYVEKDEEHRYSLTVRVLEMGMKVANRMEIRKEALPFMRELSETFHETVNLGYWDGKDVLHIDKIDARDLLRIDAPLGSRAPAYCTALGKVVLAYLSADEIDDYLDAVALEARGPNTIISRKKLLGELRRIRERGYAVDEEELARGLSCVAGPVFDHTGRAGFALSISGPTMRLTGEVVEKAHPVIVDACRRLSARLGNPGDT